MKNPKILRFIDIRNDAKQNVSNGYKGKAIVAFIDLLGFSNEIKKNFNDPSTLEKIMSVKSAVKLARNTAISNTFFDYDDNVIGEVAYADQIMISDSFVFIQKVVNTGSKDLIMNFLTVVMSVMETWKFCLDQGYTIRGGISFGDVFYNTNEIIGPAFIEAYQLESKVAINSRVLLSNEIKKIFKENILKLEPVLQDYCYHYFYKDIDGYLTLNPSTCFNLDIDGSLDKLIKLSSKITDVSVKSKYYDIINHLSQGQIYSNRDSMFL
jgi:hypothetical protein